jgi:hypothetical protein
MTSSFRNSFLAVLALCALLGGRLPAQSSATASHPESNRAILVELFTSEGCSSCPPADALLRELNDSYSHSGDLIVGLSEHVSYWDDLGWRDRFATAASTNRQTTASASISTAFSPPRPSSTASSKWSEVTAARSSTPLTLPTIRRLSPCASPH